jgi:hypothetical protein
MTGYDSKRQMVADKLQKPVVQPAPGYCKNCKDYTIEEPLYAQPMQEPVAWEWNFCERCGKRTKDLTVIHTCTPPQGNT